MQIEGGNVVMVQIICSTTLFQKARSQITFQQYPRAGEGFGVVDVCEMCCKFCSFEDNLSG